MGITKDEIELLYDQEKIVVLEKLDNLINVYRSFKRDIENDDVYECMSPDDESIEVALHYGKLVQLNKMKSKFPRE